ncbi:protein KTI12 homolog isoform X2 [Ambystoma mexicanum]|uniref:protein KTI12 homolog isoform X2 n=1 Tax=Ambystoma mexicanum TaxID=8296 RepID=UPI0037E8EBD4
MRSAFSVNMPLVILCGFPCSGKSQRVQELQEQLLQTGTRKVQVVGDEVLGVDRNSVYADSRKEKELRGALRAEVERKLNKEDVVILDSLNYIKGYRYELYCLIKHTQTPHCLIHCLTSPEVSSEWNNKRQPENQYSQEIFDALVKRFEAPDSRNRWDSPLFSLQKDDPLPFEDLCNAIFHRKAPPPNQSTQTALLNAQKTSVPGDLIVVPGANEKIELTRNLGMAELQKARRQFISYTKMHPNENISQVANMFVQYLNKSIH